MTTTWSDRYADRMERVQSSIIREILKLTTQPNVISFAGGLPAPELFPQERIAEAANRLMDSEEGKWALQYGITEGYVPLREWLMEKMRAQGTPCSLENIFITSGSQQSLDTLGKVFITPGDKIILEEPTYLGALQAWNLYGADYVTVPTDEDGIIPAELEAALEAHDIKFIYLMPNFQNPAGILLSEERRHQVLEIADRYGVPIIEDDAYGDLYYDIDPIKPLVALDATTHNGNGAETIEHGNVIYLGTFSKSLCPGFRLGWICAPNAVARRIVQAKQSADLHTSTFSQMVVYETIRDGFLEAHVEKLKATYSRRRDLMISLMEEHFPAEAEWITPLGGLFLWVTLPERINATDLLEKAVEQRVAYVPGEPFFPNGGGTNTLRVNFSNSTEEKIREGIERLAAVFADEIVAV